MNQPQFTQLPMVPAGDLLVHAKDLTPLTALVLADTTQCAVNRVLSEHRNAQALSERSLRPASRLLFWGPPGCGKTACAGAIALALGVPLYVVRLDAVIGGYMGETAGHLRKVFELAGNCRSVVFFDEADALISRRVSNSTGVDREMGRAVNSLLLMFEEARMFPSILVCATNRQDMIDPAMWRRFDEVMEFQPPTGVQAAALLKRRVGRHLPTAVIPDLRTWPKRLAGLSFADVDRLATDAVKAHVVQEWTLRAALSWSLENQRERRRALCKRGRP